MGKSRRVSAGQMAFLDEMGLVLLPAIPSPVKKRRYTRAYERNRRKTWSYAKPCTYGAAHARCRYLWGSPKLYNCIDCGGRAQDWAYDGTDSTELLGSKSWGNGKVTSTLRYSRYPEFYMPLCKDCHAKRDGRWRQHMRTEFEEFLEWRRSG